MLRIGVIWLWLAALAAATPADAADLALGCDRPLPTRPPTSFTVDGAKRRAIVVVPQGYQTGQPTALVVAFHGRTNDNARFRSYLDLEQAASEPTLFVYLAARQDGQGRFTWAGRDGREPDLALFDEIVAEMERRYCVDRGRIFLVGHSLGASFANSIACARADAVGGLASVAGGISQSHCAGRVPSLLLHNPRDPLVPLAEGKRARDVLLGAPMQASWPVSETINSFACQRAGDALTPAVWCLSEQDYSSRGRFYPHQWPQGASHLIMSFFAALPERHAPGLHRTAY